MKNKPPQPPPPSGRYPFTHDWQTGSPFVWILNCHFTFHSWLENKYGKLTDSLQYHTSEGAD